MTDLAGIKSRIKTIDLVQDVTGPARGPDGQGRWITRCPFHEDSTPSFRVTADGGYLCFGCGAKGGDVIDFVAAQRGISLAEAITALGSEVGALPPARPANPHPPSRAPSPSAVVPRPIAADAEHRLRETGTIALHYPGRDKPELLRPTAIYAYRSEPGGPASHLVIRVDRDGKKTFRPVVWDGDLWWGIAGPTPRPLYGLDRLVGDRQVVVVEGEKAADAAAARLPEQLAVLTWQGGSSSVPTADWTPLAGRSVVVWPDADAAGAKAARAIVEALETLGCRLKLVDTDGLPDGFDAADLPADEDMLLWLKGRSRPLQAEQPAPTAPNAPEAPVSAGELAQALRDEEFPFTILGQHGDRAFFLKHSDGRIVNHGLTSLTRREVLGTLAPPHVWIRAFGGQESDGRPIGWPTIGMSAQAHIIAACERRPSFDPDRVRGRGAWPHKGAVAFHRGDWTEVGGRRQTGNLVDGIIYESLSPLDVEIEQQTTDEEGRRLIELIGACSWAERSSADALAGWIALAPICGALPWRPHVWITGPSGSGKSTVMDEIVLPAVGRGLAIRVDGNTSEAGLRQAIGRDALPVLLDEAEPDAKSMRGILDLARSASTGDTVVRGTPGGGAQYFHIRSCFCFSAIDPAIAKRADESRISRLSLRPRTDAGADAHFRRLRDEISNLIGSDFGSRLAARSITLANVTIANIRIMEDSIARTYGSRRLAQQWGALLAGWWSLASRTEIDAETAAELAKRVPTESAVAQAEESDARAMLMHLCAYQVEVPTKSGRARVTIAELIERLTTRWFAEAQEIGRMDAQDVLARWGIRADRKEVTIAVNYATLRNQVFRDTNWQHSYTARLRDLEGARAGKQVRFAGTRCSSTIVPVRHFAGGDDADGSGEDGSGSDQDLFAEGHEQVF